jgi:hypothetical protein
MLEFFANLLAQAATGNKFSLSRTGSETQANELIAAGRRVGAWAVS